MINFTNQLYEEFTNEIGTLEPIKNEMKMATKKLEISVRFMDRLREFLSGYTFSSQQEEMLFFKKIKHKFYIPTLFYHELLYVYSNTPSGDKKMQIGYFRQLIERNNNFIERYRFILAYFRSGRSEHDELMFLRNSDCFPLLMEYSGDIDTSFSTVSSSILSKLLAFEEVNNYLSQKIHKLKTREQKNTHSVVNKMEDAGEQRIKFLGKKAELHELVIAMHERGDFGEVPLNWVMEAFGKILNITPGNYYSSLTDLAMRKKSRTPYLLSLIESITRRLDRKLDSL